MIQKIQFPVNWTIKVLNQCINVYAYTHIHIESVYALFWRKNLYMHFGFYVFLELIRVGSYWKVSEMNGNSIYWSKIAFGGACGALKGNYKKKQVSRRSISVKNNAICICTFQKSIYTLPVRVAILLARSDRNITAKAQLSPETSRAYILSR